MKTKSMKIASLLLTMVVLVATFCLFTTMANAAEESATLSFASTAQRVSQNSTSQVWANGGVTLTNNKASSSSNVGNYSNPARFYAGSEIIIEFPGRTITKIEFNCDSSSYATALKNSIGATAVASSMKVTVTLNETDGMFTIAKLTAQVRIRSLTVYGEVSESPDCAHENTTKTPNEDGKTHNIVCDDCKAVIAAEEEHTSSDSCDKCGWVYIKPAPEATITFDANKTQRTEYDGEKQVWVSGALVFINEKSSSTNNVGDYSAPVRLYQNSKVTISFPGMTKIVLDCTGLEAKYVNAMVSSIGTGANYTVTETDKIITVTFNDPDDSFSFSCTAQARANSITAYAEEPAECEHENKTYVSLNNQNHKVTCADCGAVVEEAHTIVGLECDKCDFVLPFEFSGWSLTLYDNLSLNFTVNAEFFANGYSNPTATFAIGKRTVVVSEYTEKDGKYVFTLSDIAPYEMTLTIQATLSATKNDETVTSTTEKTIKEYCLQILNDPTKDAKVKTLVVDLLNYGAASQTYADKYTDALANADLTDTQKEFGTQDDPNLSTVANPAYVKVDNAKVTWAGAQLRLVDTVEMNFVFKAASTEGLVVKVVTTSSTYTITEFTAYGEEGAYVASFSAFNAAQMSEIVDVTVYEGDTAVSNTYRYSIESYACAKQGDKDADLASLVNAMMKYGNSAKAYAELLKGANA